jgi:hypothetical protein
MVLHHVPQAQAAGSKTYLAALEGIYPKKNMGQVLPAVVFPCTN